MDIRIWIQHKLSSRATFSKGRGYTKNDLRNEGYPIILYGELYTNYNEVITTAENFVESDSKSIKSTGKEVIVPASGESAEDIARASSVKTQDIILGGDLNIIYPDENIFNDFLALSLSNGSVKKELIKRAQGTSITHLYNSDLKEVLIKYPQVEEQTKISNTIEMISKIITLEQEKLTLYEEIIDYIIQFLLPKNDTSKPRWRLRKYNENWEKVQLKDILKNGDKSRVDNPKEYNKLTVKLNKNGLEEFISNREMANTRPFYQRFSGELIIGKQNYFNGSIAIVPPEFDGYIASNAIMSFSVCDNDTNFVYHYLSRKNYIEKRSHLANGTGQKELSEKDFLNFNISIPSISEQRDIASFILKIEAIVENQKIKIDKLVNAKTYFLENMFI